MQETAPDTKASPGEAVKAPQSGTPDASAPALAGKKAAQEPMTFASAPSCRAQPTPTTSQPDSEGRLWGWRAGASCAFKDGTGHVLFYADYVPREWLATPACSAAPFTDASVADSKFKVWGWEDDGRLCAFKDDQQAPIPIDKHYTKLSWADTPACTVQPLPTPTNAAADKNGCLWGWQLERNCAFKNESESPALPLTYEGYKGACNASAAPSTGPPATSAAATPASEDNLAPITAAESNGYEGEQLRPAPAPEAIHAVDSPQGLAAAASLTSLPPVDLTSAEGAEDSLAADDSIEVVLNAPGSSSSVGNIGQKAPQAYYAASELAELLDQSAGTSSLPELLESLPGNPDAPFTTNLPAQSDGTRRRRALLAAQVQDPKFPKQTPVALPEWERPSDWKSGGPGSLAPPEHPGRSTVLPSLILPETKVDQQISGAESGAVTWPPVSEIAISEATWDYGAGGISPPFPTGLKRGSMIRMAARRPSFSVRPTKARTEAGPPPLGLLEAPRKLLGLSHFPAFSSLSAGGASASAVAKSTGGTAVSQSQAVAQGNQTSIATSDATAQGNGTAVSIALAGGGNQSLSEAHSEALASDGKTAVSIVDASQPAPVPGTKCVLVGKTEDREAYWSCGSSGSTPAAASPAPASPEPAQPAPADHEPASLEPASPLLSEVPAQEQPADEEQAEEPGSEPATDSLAPTWESAPRCSGEPSAATSIKDSWSRLWGWEMPAGTCAYRAPDGTSLLYEGFVPLDWYTAPACSEPPTSLNSMPDAQGQLWGFVGADNCAYKDEAGAPRAYNDAQVVTVAAAPNAVRPSAGGPVNQAVIDALSKQQHKPEQAAEAPASPDAEVPAVLSQLVKAAEVEAAVAAETNAQPDATLQDKAVAAAKAAVLFQTASDAAIALSGDKPSETNAGVVRVAEAADSLQAARAQLNAALRYKMRLA